jgi:tetratricopeptide (TPR) repeat protein
MFGLPALHKMEEALGHAREAERLDPLSAPIASDVGVLLYWSRRFDEAIEQCRKMLAVHPGFYRSHFVLGRVLAAQGRYAESVESCLKARELSESAFVPFLLGALGFAYASGGNRVAAREVMDELLRLEQRCTVTAHEQAVVSTALGDWDDAMRALGTAFEQRTGWAVWVGVEPLLDPLRARGLLSEQSFT